MTESQLVTTIKSGNVYLNLFLKQGNFGPYLEPSRPVHRYKDQDGNGKFSEYLRDQHCLHAARCYERAHDFIEDWKANKTSAATETESEPELSETSFPDTSH